MTDDLDELLVQQGKLWRRELLPVPLSSMTVDTHKRRPIWLPVAAAAAVAAVAAGVVVVPRLVGGQATHRTAAVPWVSAAPGSVLNGRIAPAKLPRAAPGIPQCDSHDFSGQVVATSTPAGVVMRLALTSASATSCWISTLGPFVEILDHHGSVLEASRGSDLVGALVVWLQVEPGQVVLTEVSWNSWCGAQVSDYALRLRLGGMGDSTGTSVTIPTSTNANPSCVPESVSPGADIQTFWPWLASAGSPDSLITTVTAPKQIQAGDVLQYTVVLTNTTPTAVSLSPCPSFTQWLGNLSDTLDPGLVKSDGKLNCAALPHGIAPHSSATFEMQLPTTGAQHRNAQLGWSWLGEQPDQMVSPQLRVL